MNVSFASIAYSEITAITLSVYTFYKLSLACYLIIRFERLKEPIVKALRIINLSDALLSLVSVALTLISVFDTGGKNKLLVSLSGFVVLGSLLVISIYIYIKATMLIKRFKENELKKEIE